MADSKLLPTNEGSADRIVRAVLGVALLSLLVIGPVPGWGLIGLLGLVLLFTAAVGSCPIYTLLGISTRNS
ncbi:MAG: DUF2892 domain-containing protein [Deltaproteobacteria bacterium]|nr:MAG: DUF2892 domain-containing protein [Deltaproteobacteria bacterium]